MTKQERIQIVYGIHWNKIKDTVNDDGWSTEKLTYTETDGETCDVFAYDCQDFNGKTLYRPYELRGVENNNGWLEINENTVFDPGLYWFVCDRYFFGKKHTFSVHYIEKGYSKFYQSNDNTIKFTHYKKISEPTKLPLY